jgi:hypothetical protein
VRLLYIISIAVVAAACGVFARSVEQWNQGDPELDRLAERSGVVEAEASAACALPSAARVSEFGSRECGVSGREAVRA